MTDKEKQIISDLREYIDKINNLVDDAHKNKIKVDITRQDRIYTGLFPKQYLKVNTYLWREE